MVSIDDIIAYEDGTLGPEETVDLFAELVKTGDVWQLQGHYGRQAELFISYGFIDGETGEVDHDRVENALAGLY